jgi:phytoene/squalene synthetase
MSDDLTVVGVDGIRRSFHKHYDVIDEVMRDPQGALYAIQRQADRIEELCLLHREYEKLLRERIEELEAKLEAVTTVRELMGHMWGDAEDKLEKAIGALEKVQAFVRDLEPHADHGHTLAPALREACETLAELKGETDD